ncbi:hypothetical protein [Alkaliphilus sp. B6464]|uniref:hypothetical protein n=1 Tax=Alkaliphilus sp. B6464 TaxID=2731219 RepID=UPI001BA443A3|nr:hypothetical protein [Alkaliphilus sp. B6464]QUH21778.1 hypothetical protein HYG84_17740 [Alkaliphilus sp. B6464]
MAKKPLEKQMNTIKAVLYFGKYAQYKLYYTKLQLLLFYYEKEYLKNFKDKILNCDFLYDGYTPKPEGLEELLEVLNSKEIIIVSDSNYGKYIKTLFHIEEFEYDEKELMILQKILHELDSLTSMQIMEKKFEPQLTQGKLTAVTKTIIEF